MKTKLMYFVLFALLFMGFASAYNDLPSNLEQGTQGAIDIVVSLVSPVFIVLFGGDSQYLFEKTLLFLIILIVVYIALKRFKIFQNQNKGILWIVVISVTILSTRFLTETQLIYNIMLPYNVLGVALTAILPFLIFFFFIHSFEEGYLRKLGWVFFSVIFITLWYMRYDELGGISWMYFWTAMIGFLFLLFDGAIRKMILRRALQDLTNEQIGEALVRVRKELDELRENRKYYEEVDYLRKEKELQKEQNRLTALKE